MPNSKQKTKSNAFYSRKYNKWFKTYESFKTYDESQKKQFSKQNIEKLVYDKNSGYLYDRKTGKRLKKPVSAYKKQ